MDYLLDTNIILNYIRKDSYSSQIDEKYSPLSIENSPIISVVTRGEILSIAFQNNWGNQKINFLKVLLDKFIIADINVDSIVDRYAEIDAFSQGKLPNKKLKVSARNMGKNDIWIAATASVLEIKLLTTDKDFSHLKDEFLDLELIKLV
jgi:predicted nucleic acid-binding protein